MIRRVSEGIRTALALLRDSDVGEPDSFDVGPGSAHASEAVLDTDTPPPHPARTEPPMLTPQRAPAASSRVATGSKRALCATAPVGDAALSSSSSSSAAASVAPEPFARVVRARTATSPRHAGRTSRPTSPSASSSTHTSPSHASGAIGDAVRFAALLDGSGLATRSSEMSLPDADEVIACLPQSLPELLLGPHVPMDLQTVICDHLCRNAPRMYAGGAGGSGSLPLHVALFDASAVPIGWQPVWGHAHGRHQWLDHRAVVAEADEDASGASERLDECADDIHATMYSESVARVLVAAARHLSVLTIRMPVGTYSMPLLPPAIGTCLYLTSLCLDGIPDAHLMFHSLAQAPRLRHLEVRNSIAVHRDVQASITAVGMSVRAAVSALFANSRIAHFDFSSDRDRDGVHPSGALWSAAMVCALADPALELPGMRLVSFVVDANMHDSVRTADTGDAAQSGESSSSSSSSAPDDSDATASIVHILSRNRASLRFLTWKSPMEPPVAVLRAVPNLEAFTARFQRGGAHVRTLHTLVQCCPALRSISCHTDSRFARAASSGIPAEVWTLFAPSLTHLELSADIVFRSGTAPELYLGTALASFTLLASLRIPLVPDLQQALSRASLPMLRRLVLDLHVPHLPLVTLESTLAVYTHVVDDENEDGDDDDDDDLHAIQEARVRTERTRERYRASAARRSAFARDAAESLVSACKYAAGRGAGDTPLEIVVAVGFSRVVPPTLEHGLIAARRVWSRISVSADPERWTVPAF